jgi:hypothetical protein
MKLRLLRSMAAETVDLLELPLQPRHHLVTLERNS